MWEGQFQPRGCEEAQARGTELLSAWAGETRGHGGSRQESGHALLPAHEDMDTVCSARDGKAQEWGVGATQKNETQNNQYPDGWLVDNLPRNPPHG